MKKITLLTICFFAFITASQAQITKGSVLLGGGISGSKSRSESGSTENKSSSFGFYPAVGVAVKDNAVVGMRLSYLKSKNETLDPSNQYLQKHNGYSAGLFYRRYLPLGKSFYLYGEGTAYYSFQEGTNEYNSANQKSIQTNKSVGVYLYPGVAYAVGKRFHLELELNNLLGLGYTSSKTESGTQGQGGTSKGSSFNFSTNLSSATPLSVGFRFVLGK